MCVTQCFRGSVTTSTFILPAALRVTLSPLIKAVHDNIMDGPVGIRLSYLRVVDWL
jgi:hypothetical protein